MKVPYCWLKEFVDIKLSPEELAKKLTLTGLEVEEVISSLPDIKGIYVAEVLSVNKHPNADKLFICEVQTGKDKVQVICGAPNVRKDLKVAFAPSGTILPNNVKIKKASIRGVDSFGMICSKEELSLEEKSEGIWEVPVEWKIGEDIKKLLSLTQDYTFDISITPNRPDAMSIIGMAREVAAITGVIYKIPEIKLKEIDQSVSEEVSVDIMNPEGCPRYAARVIKDLKIGPSPQWMQDRLQKCGIRAINNIVDITNYVLLEMGQPLHAFDLNQIQGKKIIVKDSSVGDKFITLDEKERMLPEKTVMICDGKQPVAIGGIMGGMNSEVVDSTVDILLESAYFTPVRISRASKKMNLSTEASQRFERGIDPNGVIRAINRAASLLEEFAGGKVYKDVLDKYPAKIVPWKFKVRSSRINKILGTDLSDKKISEILASIGIEFKNGLTTIPTFRPDIEREIDIVEEVARLIGYDSIPVKEKTSISYDVLPNYHDIFQTYIRDQIQGIGFSEVITNSMVSSRELEKIKDPAAIKIMNPVSDDMNILRSSLIPGLLKTVAYNINRNNFDQRIYEIGRVFRSLNIEDENSQPYQLCGIIQGDRFLRGWEGEEPKVDFYDIKGLVELFLNKISLDKYQFILYDNDVYFDLNQSIKIQVKGETVGHFGKIKSEVSNYFGIESDAFGFEFDFNKLEKYSIRKKDYQPYSKFPFIEKDLCFVVDDKLYAEEIRENILKKGQPLVNNVFIFDLFENKQLGSNRKSLAFRIQFQSKERTLQDKEVTRILKEIIIDTENKFQAKLRE